MATQENLSGTLGRGLLLVLAVVIFVPLLLMLVTMPMMGMMGAGTMTGTGMTEAGTMTGTGMGGGWGFGIMFVFITAILAIAYLGYRLVKKSALLTEDPALQELRVEFAHGELTEEEFEDRYEKLTENKP